MTQSILPFCDEISLTQRFPTSFVNYEIYHDESQKDGFWHGMLFIPTKQKKIFYDLLQCERKRVNYGHKFSFKDIRSRGEKFYLADAWLSLAIGFLRSKVNKEKHYSSFWEINTKFKHGCIMPNSFLGAKFVLFRVADNHESMTYFKDKVCNIETTARMTLKGGLHYLGNPENPIHIEKIHFDGREHHLRDLNEERIIDRIDGLREYCSFSEGGDLFDTRSSNFSKEKCQDYIDCEFLILTDLLIGSFRVALSDEKNRYKRKLGKHAELILERFIKGPARMKNSRWANSFCLSQCRLENNNWIFNELNLKEPSSNESGQHTYLEFD